MEFSKIGFGCYRVDHRIEEHYRAMYKALTGGVNLIDTSSNYSDGNSEILVGNVLSDLLSEGKIKREDIITVTKAGYIQGQNYSFALKRKHQGKPFKDVVEYSSVLWHCISPDFLEDQLNRQLFRLEQNSNGGYIDIYLLHNPEYYLLWSEKRNIPKSEAHEEYYSRIKKSFEFLEEKVRERKILSYGISSNTFPVSSDRYDFTSVEKILEIAESISSSNHFRAIQFPFNFIECGAFTEKNQVNNSKTVLEIAIEKNLKTLINRPFNAITSQGLFRLVDYGCREYSEKELTEQIKKVKSAESFLDKKFSKPSITGADIEELRNSFVAGKVFSEKWNRFSTIEQLGEIIEHYFFPKFDFLYNYFDSDNLKSDITHQELRENFYLYMKEVYRMLNMVTSHYRHIANGKRKFINRLIGEMTNPEFNSLKLSQKSIALLGSISGVDCILAGMRKEKYVEDLLPVLKMNDIKNASEIILKLKDEFINQNISGIRI